MPTHAIKFAPFADEIIVMKKGKVVQMGSYQEISHTPEFQALELKEYRREERKEIKKRKHRASLKEKEIETDLLKFKEVIDTREQ